jgi:hypothetical protein
MGVGNVRVSTSDGQRFSHMLWERQPQDMHELSPAIAKDVRNVFEGNEDASVSKSSVDRWIQYKDELNSHGFRSEEFVSDHSEKYHVVFIGDSNTFGEGLDVQETWAKLLYDRISEAKECSGFFNLGMPGKSNRDMVMNILKYVSMFGKPDAIFISLTELNRFYALDNKENRIRTSRVVGGNHETLKFAMFDYYFMLEQYCKTNGINLIAFSWDDGSSKSYDKKLGCVNEFMALHKFETFVNIDSKQIRKWVAHNIDNTDPYWIRARDGSHYGTGYHKYWQSVCFEQWNKNRLGE